jgi:ethanolamine utilization protein EutA
VTRVVAHHWHPGHADVDDAHHDGELESDVMWLQDNVILHSVGVDIGSATTQVAFSRLHMRRHAEDLTSRYVVVERELVYDAGVRLTPYVEGRLIDAVAIGQLIDEAYAGSGWTAGDIDTGAVILTGEALRRANAERIGRVIARHAGDLVCVTAGHHMEALLAAYGSGTVRRSHDAGTVLLNVDIGGGTTKLTLVDCGRIAGTAAILVGGRLIATGPDGVITTLEPGGAHHAAARGLHWAVGDRVDPSALRVVAEKMADVIVAAVSGQEIARELVLTEVAELPKRVDGVVVSGGVSAYLHGREDCEFGDLGKGIATALGQRFERALMPGPLLAGEETIRATVVGASEHTVQLSGITGYISDPGASLPRRDLPVARPAFELAAEIDETAVADAVRGAFAGRERPRPDRDVVLAIRWSGEPRYRRVSALARSIAAGLDDRVASGRSLYLMIDGDIAMTLGRLLAEEVGLLAPLVVLDGIQLREFDHVDLGRIRPISGNVAVTIKSLVFSHGLD